MDTVAPYAARIGASVETDAAFALPGASPEQSARQAASSIARLTADGVPAVVCTHRENIPALMAAACQQLGATPPADPSLAKGSFWVLQMGDGKLAGLERQELSGLSGGLSRSPAAAGLPGRFSGRASGGLTSWLPFGVVSSVPPGASWVSFGISWVSSGMSGAAVGAGAIPSGEPAPGSPAAAVRVDWAARRFARRRRCQAMNATPATATAIST